MGGEETLLSVAGLGAYVGTKSGTTQPREWEYFWHEHRRCSCGHSTIRNSAAILTHVSTLRWNINNSLQHGHYEQAWLSSIALIFKILHIQRVGNFELKRLRDFFENPNFSLKYDFYHFFKRDSWSIFFIFSWGGFLYWKIFWLLFWEVTSVKPTSYRKSNREYAD